MMTIVVGGVVLAFNPLAGDRLRSFVRHALNSDGSRISIPVVEVYRGDKFRRVYLHPTRGAIESTEDLYFQF